MTPKLPRSLGAITPRPTVSVKTFTGRVPTQTRAEAQAPTHAPRSTGAEPSASTPELPDPQGSRASVRDVQAAAAALNHTEGDVSGFMAYYLLQKTQMRTLETQGAVQRAAQHSQFSGRTSEVRHTVDQIAGQSRSALISVGGSLATMGISMLMASSDSMTLRSPLGQLHALTSPFVNVADRCIPFFGGVAKSNKATIALKEDSQGIQAASQLLETAKAAMDQAREELRNSTQLVTGYLQRWSDVSDRMTR